MMYQGDKAGGGTWARAQFTNRVLTRAPYIVDCTLYIVVLVLCVMCFVHCVMCFVEWVTLQLVVAHCADN